MGQSLNDCLILTNLEYTTMQKTLLASLIATALATPLHTVQAAEVSDQLEVFGTIEVE